MTRTIGQAKREEHLAKWPASPKYDPDRELFQFEDRCPDCGYITIAGTEAERAHDNLCSEPDPSDPNRAATAEDYDLALGDLSLYR